MDFYKDAPYKKQGRIPFGVQHSTFLTTEEKVRRKWREWSSSGASASNNGKGATPSYKELVSSMKVEMRDIIMIAQKLYCCSLFTLYSSTVT
jgi:acetyl-CoA carboxylase carboxyl transferase subunit beta